MNESRIIEFNASQIYALFGCGAAALLITGLQPVLLGSLIDAGMVSLTGAGHLASIEMAALGAGVGVATLLFPLRALRVVAGLGAVLLASANFASAFATGFEQLIAFRVMSGFAAGTLIWIVTCLIVRTGSPERLAGYYMAGYTLVQSIAVAFLAVYLVPEYGWRGCFFLLGGASLIPLLLVSAVPNNLVDLPRHDSSVGTLSPAMLLTALIIFFQVIMTITIWAFLEPIGQLTGASPQSVQFIISISLLAQIAGAAIAGYVAPKYSAAISLLIVSVILTTVALYVLNISAFANLLFLPIALIFSFCWMFMLPFQTKLAMEIDPSGRLAMIVPPIQIAGSAIAPSAGGLAAGQGPASGVAIIAVSCGVIAIAILTAVQVFRARFARG